MKKFLLLAIIAIGLNQTGCSTAAQEQAQSVSASLAAQLTAPTANGQPLDEVLAEQILAAWNVSGPKTTAFTGIGTALVNGTLLVATNLKAQGVTNPATIAAAQTAYLDNSTVQEAAAQVAVSAPVVTTNAATVPAN